MAIEKRNDEARRTHASDFCEANRDFLDDACGSTALCGTELICEADVACAVRYICC